MRIKEMKLGQKIAAAAAAGALVVGGGSAAFAYFSGGASTGAGTGTASSTATATVNNLTTSAALHSGTVAFNGTASPIDITVTNPNPYSVAWSSDSVSIDTVTPATGKSCPEGGTAATNSFVISGTSAAGNTVGASPATKTIDSGFSVAFVDLGTGTDQSGCIGATINFHDSVS